MNMFSGERHVLRNLAAYAALGPLALGGGVANAQETQPSPAAVEFDDGADDLNFSRTIDTGDKTELGTVVSFLNLDCDDPALDGYEDAYSSSGTIYSFELPPFGDSQVIGEVESWGQGEAEPRVYSSALMATALEDGNFLVTSMEPEMGDSDVINILNNGEKAVYTDGSVELSFEANGSADAPSLLGTVRCLDEEQKPTKVIPQTPSISPESADPSIA
ncbi:MAG: hypothetical protein M3Q36_02305 [bacterium]|nr:hypothetical protein [bacterium]